MPVGQDRYGNTRFGYTEDPEPIQVERSQIIPEKGITPEEAFGSGWKLATDYDVATGVVDYHWDLVVLPDGSLAKVSGEDMLFQDIALYIARQAHKILHTRMTPEQIERLKIIIGDFGEGDDRIRRVERNDITPHPTRDRVEVDLQFLATYGEYHERVFTLPGNQQVMSSSNRLSQATSHSRQ